MRTTKWEKFSVRKEKEEEEENLKDFPFHRYLDRNLKFVEDDFNLWIIHTNFPIMELDIDLIQMVPGVESLDIFSQYRLRIGIGNLFLQEKVQKDIDLILKSSESLELCDDETKTKVQEILETFKDEKHWAVLILPNGRVVSYVGKTEEDLQNKVSFFEKIQEICQCQLLRS